MCSFAATLRVEALISEQRKRGRAPSTTTFQGNYNGLGTLSKAAKSQKKGS